jgi:putative transposase
VKRYGRPHVILTDLLPSYCAAMKVIGNSDRQETGRWKKQSRREFPLAVSMKRSSHVALPPNAKFEKFVAVYFSV